MVLGSEAGSLRHWAKIKESAGRLLLDALGKNPSPCRFPLCRQSSEVPGPSVLEASGVTSSKQAPVLSPSLPPRLLWTSHIVSDSLLQGLAITYIEPTG